MVLKCAQMAVTVDRADALTSDLVEECGQNFGAILVKAIVVMTVCRCKVCRPLMRQYKHLEFLFLFLQLLHLVEPKVIQGVLKSIIVGVGVRWHLVDTLIFLFHAFVARVVAGHSAAEACKVQACCQLVDVFVQVD